MLCTAEIPQPQWGCEQGLSGVGHWLLILWTSHSPIGPQVSLFLWQPGECLPMCAWRQLHHSNTTVWRWVSSHDWGAVFVSGGGGLGCTCTHAITQIHFLYLDHAHNYDLTDFDPVYNFHWVTRTSILYHTGTYGWPYSWHNYYYEIVHSQRHAVKLACLLIVVTIIISSQVNGPSLCNNNNYIQPG